MEIEKRLSERFNSSFPRGNFKEIVERYSESHRSHHNLMHIDECFEEFDEVQRKLKNPKAVEGGIWYHDIIYKIGEKDNEKRSAVFGFDRLNNAGFDSSFCSEVYYLILATKDHFPIGNPDSKYFIDIDMAILGKPWERFKEFREGVRKEYSTKYSPKELDVGTVGFFSGLSSKDIYLTEYFKEKYENQARENIRKLLNSYK